MNPSRIQWTEAQDAVIRDLRAKSVSWTKIAQEIGICRNSTISRGRTLGLHGTVVEEAVPCPTKGRFTPLPAGSPETWGVISGGAPWPGGKT
jgi:hypothetical protein